MMNNSLSTLDVSSLSLVTGGADFSGGPAGPSFGPDFTGGPAGPSFDPGSFQPNGPRTPLTLPTTPAAPSKHPEMDRWAEWMNALSKSGWFELGR